MKGKALKRAAETKDSIRIDGDIPLIVDTTELITPAKAEEMMKKNKSNRPVNWNKVELYSKMMKDGKWKLHAQGIILDNKGNLLTGQKRLLAIIFSTIPQYMRISRGSPPDTANLIDRGTTQSPRDLATRLTERKHSPMEATVSRGIYILQGKQKPTVDDLSEVIVEYSDILEESVKQTRRIKKTKSIYMIMACVCYLNPDNPLSLFGRVEMLAESLEEALHPTEADKCWNRGAAFVLAMDKSKEIVEEQIKNELSS